MARRLVLALVALVSWGLFADRASASEAESPRDIHYVTAPPAPAGQSQAQASMKSMGCLTCHVKTDEPTMHVNPGIVLGCADCHGGNAQVAKPEGAQQGDAGYQAALEKAHVLPRYPETWHFPSSANRPRTYTLLNKESPEFVSV